MTDEISLIRENIFGPQTEYITLLKLAGDKAKAILAAIKRNGPDSVLTSLLCTANLEPTAHTTSKPWGMFVKEYSLGDYRLVWSDADSYICIFEVYIPSDPYSNI